MARTSRLASSAVAATVEETLTRVASLPDHVLDNQELLEGFTLEAFEQAAAANLPALFSDATYKKRPELLEGGVNAAWVMLPLRRPRYKRCSRTFNVTITPHMAEAIEELRGRAVCPSTSRISWVFRKGKTSRPRSTCSRCCPAARRRTSLATRAEMPGLGAADEATLSQLQPLTHEAAAVLLGSPRSGAR